MIDDPPPDTITIRERAPAWNPVYAHLKSGQRLTYEGTTYRITSTGTTNDRRFINATRGHHTMTGPAICMAPECRQPAIYTVDDIDLCDSCYSFLRRLTFKDTTP